MELELQEAIRKPFPVKVIQVTLQNIEAVAEWCNGTIEQRPTRMLGTTTDLPVIKIQGQGDHRNKQFEAALGCWVVGLNGSFRSYKPLQFDAAFDVLPSLEESIEEGQKTIEALTHGSELRDHVAYNGVPNAEAPVYESD